MSHGILRLLMAAAVIAPIGCGQASGDQREPVSYPFVLTQDELALARSLAERDLPPDGPAPSSKMVFIKVDLLPGSHAESTRRLVMVHHYRYQTDETVFTMIDLHTHEVLKRESSFHYATALAPSEVERALQLVHADGRLGPLLAVQPTQFDARPIQFSTPGEPLYGHRVVHVLPRQNGDYVMNMRILVDLTSETVHMDMN